MARQILTFLIIFLGLLLVMRSCSPAEEYPPAERLEPAPAPAAEDVVTLNGADGLAVRLDRSGTILTVQQGGARIVGRAPYGRRPFNVVLEMSSGKLQQLRWNVWEATPIPDGYEFRYADGDLKLRKRVLLVDGGVDLQLKVEGAPEGVRGFVLTGPSGVPLEGGGEGDEPLAFWRLGERPAWVRSLQQQVESQEALRATRIAQVKENPSAPIDWRFHRRERTTAEDRVHRLGVLGATHYVALEDLPPVDDVNVEAYRAKRDDGDTPEFETWVGLVAVDGGYDESFHLRWAPRATAGEREPALRKRLTDQGENVLWLESEAFRLGLSDRGAAIRELLLKHYSTVAGEDPAPENWVPAIRDAVRRTERALALSGDADRFGVDPADARWEALPADDAVVFRLTTPQGYRLEKRISIPAPDAFHIDVQVRIEPPPGRDVERVKFKLVGPSGSYIADAYRGTIATNPPAGFLLERRGGDDDDKDLKHIGEEPLIHGYGSETNHLLRAVGVRGGFFAGVLLTEDVTDREGRAVGTVVEAGVRAIRLEAAVERPDGESSRESLSGYVVCEVPVAEGAAVARFRYYAGPTALDELRPLGLEDAVNFGFFGGIGRALMWLMKLLQSLVGSYGVAIMLLTFVVRCLLLPVSFKTQLGMQRYSKRLQKIKPILEELEKKYKTNKQKLNQERMRVMREHKVGFPLGCLMIFFQIPIWFALFGALRVEFSLRHQPFLWCNDLTMPDRLFAMPFFENVPVLPVWFNFFPILMLVLWVTQQKVAPQAGTDDPQVKAQMKMVKFMPYIFFFMLYNYAAALAVYMCVSSTWSIFEGRLVRKAVARAIE